MKFTRKPRKHVGLRHGASIRHVMPPRFGTVATKTAVIAVFATVGVILLIHSHAGTPSNSIETEAGTTTSCATVSSDSTASKGLAVKLGTCRSNGFTHPGILLGMSQLNFVKNQVAASAAPWKSAFTTMTGSHFAPLSYVAQPAAVLSRSTNAATNIQTDDIAAYTDALIYYYTGNTQYADTSIEIMNAWSSTLTSVDSTSQLDAAWAAEMFPRAAEIIRYTYMPATGHTPLNVGAFSTMLTNVLLPQLDQTSNGSTYSNGNWELSMADGTMNIGVFTNNRAVFNTGVAMWRARVPAYIYEASDGPTPVHPPGGRYDSEALTTCFWVTGGQHTTSCTIPAGFKFSDGMAQETCRDSSHVTIGFEAMVNGAETARLQGVDLYGEQKQRIIDGYEFASKYDKEALANPGSGGTSGTVSNGSVCGGSLNYGGVGYKIGWEIAYNEFHNRLGVAMPNTLAIINDLRPAQSALDAAFETVTSPGTP